MRRYASLFRSWDSAGEVKDSSLKEPQVAAVLYLLVEMRCLFLVCATEMSVDAPAALYGHGSIHTGCCPVSESWSGWTESNRRYLFGREEFCH